MEKDISYKPPLSPPKENLNHDVDHEIHSLSEEKEKVRKWTWIFALLLAGAFLLVMGL